MQSAARSRSKARFSVGFRGAVASFLALLLSGCASSAGTQPQPSEARSAGPNYAGLWTRASDGLTFRVTDDGKKVSGRLETDPARSIERYDFILEREGGALVGKAQIQAKGSSVVVEGTWRLRPQGSDGVAGETEYALVSPKTGKILGRGTDSHVFRISAPTEPAGDAAVARSDEAKRLREEADRVSAAEDREEEERKALRLGAESVSDEADKDEAEKRRLREAADALAGQ